MDANRQIIQNFPHCRVSFLATNLLRNLFGSGSSGLGINAFNGFRLTAGNSPSRNPEDHHRPIESRPLALPQAGTRARPTHARRSAANYSRQPEAR